MVFGIAVMVGVSFAVGYALGSPNVIEQEVTKNITTEKAEITGKSGTSGSGRATIEKVDAKETSVIGASGGGANGSVNCNR